MGRDFGNGSFTAAKAETCKMENYFFRKGEKNRKNDPFFLGFEKGNKIFNPQNVLGGVFGNGKKMFSQDFGRKGPFNFRFFQNFGKKSVGGGNRFPPPNFKKRNFEYFNRFENFEKDRSLFVSGTSLGHCGPSLLCSPPSGSELFIFEGKCGKNFVCRRERGVGEKASFSYFDLLGPSFSHFEKDNSGKEKQQGDIFVSGEKKGKNEEGSFSFFEKRESKVEPSFSSARVSRTSCSKGRGGEDLNVFFGAQTGGDADALPSVGPRFGKNEEKDGDFFKIFMVNNEKIKRLKRFNFFSSGKVFLYSNFLERENNFALSSPLCWEKYFAEEKRAAPLHAPNVGVISFSFFELLKKDVLFLSKEQKEVFSFLEEEKSFPIFEKWISNFPSSDFSFEETKVLVENKILEKTDSFFTDRCVGYIFKVFEKEKNRNRVVQDCLSCNIFCKKYKVSFDKITFLRKKIASFSYGFEIDFKAFFFQFLLGEKVRKFFKVRIGESFFQFSRLPMGFANAVPIAHFSSSFLCFLVLEHFCGEEIFCFVYIDNILVVGNKKEVLFSFLSFFQEKTKEFNFTVGSLTPIESFVVFRGIFFDLKKKIFRMKDSFVEKVCFRFSLVKQTVEENRLLFGEFRSLMGSVVYFCSCLGVPLGKFFYCLKLLARNALSSPKKEIFVWKKVKEELLFFLSVLRKEQFLTFSRESQNSFLVADACGETAVIASVLVLNGSIFLFSKKMQSKNIMLLEAEAIQQSLFHFAEKIVGSCLFLYGDNLSVLCSLSKGFSKNFELNIRVVSILNLLRNNFCDVYLFYVPSDFNVADPFSRDSVFLDSLKSNVLEKFCENQVVAFAKQDDSNKLCLSFGVEEVKRSFHFF